MTTVQTIYDWLDGFAPFQTAEDFDNVGLLIGDPRTPVASILFCLDATTEAARTARKNGVQLIVSHHPLMFGGLKRIHYGEPEGQAIAALCEGRVNLIAAHTNLDQAPGGIADSLAKALLLQNVHGTLDPYVKVGDLPLPLTTEAWKQHAAHCLNADIHLYEGAQSKLVSRVAVGPGACGDGYRAALENGADAFITGEIHHHQLLAACGHGLIVTEAGHYATEFCGVKALYERFLMDCASPHEQVCASLYSYAPYRGATRPL